ncbi:MAG TPA: hypothetical protein H9873_04855 [Candidatus Dorea gallistercoris]|uniref:Uncharacterized protein n=1 Tax=Candidatus Dorea gallistercoris TaxID=2838542 RepID=A0A9D1R9W1_9FIRM|nr:hypothetical protein [Candidatus Dorea gallistercoris]
MSQSEIDGARISDLKGAASLDGSTLRTLTVTEPVEFTYNCGSGQTMVVSLNVYAANQWGRELSMEGWKYGETAKRPTATARFGLAASVKTGDVTAPVPMRRCSLCQAHCQYSCYTRKRRYRDRL